MCFIFDRLKPNGKLLVQIPNINKNPFYSLMGDQCFIFSQLSLTNVLKHYGFKVINLIHEYFPRELFVLAIKQNKSKNIGFNNKID